MVASFLNSGRRRGPVVHLHSLCAVTLTGSRSRGSHVDSLVFLRHVHLPPSLEQTNFHQSLSVQTKHACIWGCPQLMWQFSGVLQSLKAAAAAAAPPVHAQFPHWDQRTETGGPRRQEGQEGQEPEDRRPERTLPPTQVSRSRADPSHL